jgi:hypothetical protein
MNEQEVTTMKEGQQVTVPNFEREVIDFLHRLSKALDWEFHPDKDSSIPPLGRLLDSDQYGDNSTPFLFACHGELCNVISKLLRLLDHVGSLCASRQERLHRAIRRCLAGQEIAGDVFDVQNAVGAARILKRGSGGRAAAGADRRVRGEDGRKRQR